MSYDSYKIFEEMKAATDEIDRIQLQDMVELKGTERQIDWAEKIRPSIFKKVREECVNLPSNSIEPLSREEIDFAIRRYVIIINILKNKASASWWINHRLASVETIYEEIKDEVERKDAEMIEQNDTVAISAKAEATVYPNNQTKPGIAEINCTDDYVTVIYPRNEYFRQLVRNLGYSWDSKLYRWKLDINYTTGGSEDRAAELGSILLNNGYGVLIYDAEVRRKAIAADFGPRCYRWVVSFSNNDNLGLKFPKDENLYKKARELPGAHWDSPYVIIPIEYGEMVLDFAEIYDFRVTPSAIKKIEAYKQSMLPPVTPAKPKSPDKKVDKLQSILESSREVLEDLRDEDDN